MDKFESQIVEYVADLEYKEYNQFRPHSSLGYRPPATEAIQPVKVGILT